MTTSNAHGKQRRRSQTTITGGRYGDFCRTAKFTDQGIKTAKESPKRAEAFKQMAKSVGVTVRDIFWTQGRYDIVAITEAPDEPTGTALNLSLGALGNIRTESLRAYSADEMTKIIAKMV